MKVSRSCGTSSDRKWAISFLDLNRKHPILVKKLYFVHDRTRKKLRRKNGFSYRHYGCVWHYLWHWQLQSTHFVPSLNDLLCKKYHKWGPPKQMPSDALSQIAIFTVKITKRFACANEQRAQQTGDLPTELTRRWSNLGSGSHGQLWTPTFRKAPPPLLLRHITENSFFMETNRSDSISLSTIWLTVETGVQCACLSSF